MDIVLRQKQLDIFSRETADDAVVLGENGIRELPFSLLEFQHARFDRVLGDQPIREDTARLPDPVCPIDRLREYGNVGRATEPVQLHICLPYAGTAPRAISFVARTAGDPSALRESVRGALHGVRAGIPVCRRADHPREPT